MSTHIPLSAEERTEIRVDSEETLERHRLMPWKDLAALESRWCLRLLADLEAAEREIADLRARLGPQPDGAL